MKWQRGSFCSNSQGCLEAAINGDNGAVLIRDSHEPDTHIEYSQAEWSVLLTKIKNRVPVFEKVNAFETERGPKEVNGQDYTVLFTLSAPWSSARLYVSEPELDAFIAAVRADELDYDQLREGNFFGPRVG